MGRAVIKSGEEVPPAQGRFRLDLRDVGEKAGVTLDEARAEARQIVARGRADADVERRRIVEDARRVATEAGMAAGRQQGYEQALAEARARFEAEHGQLAKSLAQAATEFNRRREEFLVAARQDVVALAIALAGRVVNRLTQIDSAALPAAQEACAAALELIGPATEVTVRINPADRAALGELVAGDRDSSVAKAADATSDARPVRIVEDAGIQRGGARVTAADVEIDATVGQRVERVADELLAVWRERVEQLKLEA